MKNHNRPQAQKKISFIVHYPYQWFIYRNIYNKLPADKREVIIDLNVNPQIQNDELKETIIALLKQEGVTFRVLERVFYFNDACFRSFFAEVEIIVSCWEFGCVSSQHTAHIKKVNTTYGLAKELTMLRPTRSIYDVILAYGERDRRLFSLLTKSIAIGNPRLDNFYSGRVDKSVREKLFAHLDDKKKTVLYIPTHGDLGSFHEMLPVFKRLSGRYNVVFKPHYYTLREEKETLEKYRQVPSLLVIDDTWDTIEVMALSDVVVSDNSSSIFDAMQVDKSLIVCDFLGNQFLDIVHKKLRFDKKGISGALTYSNSFEQEIKKKGLVATIKKPDDLDDALENIAEIDGRFSSFRKELVRSNFSFTDGRSSERAAEIILRLYKAKREHVSGILDHAYRAFNNQMFQWNIESENREVLLAPVAMKTLVWVFCESGQHRDEVLGTLYSALNEKEVVAVCVTGALGEDVINTFSRGIFSGRISYFEDHGDGIGFVYSQLGGCDQLLFVKANTHISDLRTVNNFKVSSKRDMLFFSENILIDPEDSARDLFYRLKHEMLGLQGLSRNTLIFIPRDILCSCEKSAAIIDSKTLLYHLPPQGKGFSFEDILVFFMRIDSLKYQGRDYYGLLCNDHALMPNFFINGIESQGTAIVEKLVARGMILHSLGIPVERWPDKKIGKFLFEIITGNFEYYQLLKLVLTKIFLVKRDALFYKMNVFLEKMLRENKKD